MDKQRKKRIKRYLAWGCLAALVVVLAAMPLMAAGSSEDDGPIATIKSGTVESGSITSVLNGGGTLTEEDAVTVTIPSGVKLVEFLVENGDPVSEGDPLASVDRISVMTAIAEVQDTLDYLAEEIEAADDEEGAAKIKAQTAGKVKLVYAKDGDNVQDVILQHGALAVLSLDGRMAVDVETDARLTVGDSVTVIVDEDEVTGHVESALGNTLIITVADDDYEVGETARVKTTDGDYLGYGSLYIHNPWNATAYYGTVSTVEVEENDTVSAGEVLLTLENTSHSTQYELLVQQRQEYEDVMAELFRMYQNEAITAPCDGIVSGVEKDSTYLLASENTCWTVTLLSNITDTEQPEDPEIPAEPEIPGGEGEEPGIDTPAATFTGCIAYVTAAEDGTLTFLTNDMEVTISNPNDLTKEQKDTSAMTTIYPYTGNPYLYVIVDGTLQLTATPAAAGDLVLIVDDNTLISLGSTVSDTPGGSQNPGNGSMSGSFGMNGGFSGGGSGGVTIEPTFEPYDLTEYAVLTVTPQNAMTLDITIDELDIGKLAIGQAADITVTALSDDSFSGSVTGIGSAENSGGNSKFTVTITLERGGQMLSGMSACASMALSTVENALIIPAAALNDNGSEVYVYTSYDAKTESFGNPVTVTTGVSDGENVEILSGLEEGDTYYYAYFDAQETN